MTGRQLPGLSERDSAFAIVLGARRGAPGGPAPHSPGPPPTKRSPGAWHWCPDCRRQFGGMSVCPWCRVALIEFDLGLEVQ